VELAWEDCGEATTVASVDDQQQAERSLFLDFAETAGLHVVEIKSRLPPEPDILCEIAGEGLVAFELGEVVCETLERAVNEHRSARERFQVAIAALPDADRHRIETRLGGPPAVYVTFTPRTPPGRWRHAVSPIVRWLTERAKVDGPTGLFPGDVDACHLGTLAAVGVTDLTIRRTPAKEAFFGIAEPLEVVDATERMVKKKLQGAYTSSAPMELLLYWAAAPAPRKTAWRDELLANIRAARPTSPFRRVWCFDLFARAVVIVDPECSPLGSGAPS
jgi:hypothetical protein